MDLTERTFRKYCSACVRTDSDGYGGGPANKPEESAAG